MGKRIIREWLDDDGGGVATKWIAKQFTGNRDRGKIESRFSSIEACEDDNPSWVKRYKSLKMIEIRVDYDSKAIRFLCEEIGNALIILDGCVKRGKIPQAVEDRAVRRREALEKDQSNVRNYPLESR